MSEPTADRDPFEVVAESFLARFRAGERPSVTEYAAAHPELADEIRELLPALVMVEQDLTIDPDPNGTERHRVRLRARSTLGDYRILREIGRGGMGVVYEAEQVSLGRRVALKVLPGHVAATATPWNGSAARPRPQHGCITPTSCRSSRSARMARSPLRHAVHPGPGARPGHQRVGAAARRHATTFTGRWPRADRGRYRDRPSPGRRGRAELRVASERPVRDRRGGTVQRNIADGSTERLRPDDAICTSDFVLDDREPVRVDLDFDPGRPRPCCRVAVRSRRSSPFGPAGSVLPEPGPDRPPGRRGLAYAHASGIVHRDIKPSNLLLDNEGVVWIADFGLAKADDDGLTHTGDILGTLRYMAPERFRGEGDARADIYALGLTLYELLTLRPAFDSSDRLKLIEQIKTEEPPQAPGPRSPAFRGTWRRSS